MKLKDILLDDAVCNNFLSYIHDKKGDSAFEFINDIPMYIDKLGKKIWVINQSFTTIIKDEIIDLIESNDIRSINIGENTIFDPKVEQKLKLLNFSSNQQGISVYNKKTFPIIQRLSDKYFLEAVDKDNFEESVQFLYDEDFYPASIKVWKETYQENILGFIIRDKNGQIVANASCVYQTEDFGVIWGVATNEKHRRQGLATHLTLQLVTTLMNMGKKSLLYFTEDKIGRFYGKMGFETKHTLITYWRKNNK
ncbi:GNAT family N-acetyltransferase [Mycoplasma sp. CSL10137]|uniref:GNAT family N-acetyltransferase n=1 Tax=Mycoplasma sp. CSL10137 TaxID=2813824 RepID=UPI00197C9FBE|nr:GNAT family N-acetyltransferase [Mycoplasma sp. CSL10137]MBN4083851.1 GNAT family N-acetyltransferase [Mycoplasma sp. CSL10137]